MEPYVSAGPSSGIHVAPSRALFSERVRSPCSHHPCCCAQARAEQRREGQQRKRKKNDDRVAQGLSGLMAKYGLGQAKRARAAPAADEPYGTAAQGAAAKAPAGRTAPPSAQHDHAGYQAHFTKATPCQDPHRAAAREAKGAAAAEVPRRGATACVGLPRDAELLAQFSAAGADPWEAALQRGHVNTADNTCLLCQRRQKEGKLEKHVRKSAVHLEALARARASILASLSERQTRLFEAAACSVAGPRTTPPGGTHPHAAAPAAVAAHPQPAAQSEAPTRTAVHSAAAVAYSGGGGGGGGGGGAAGTEPPRQAPPRTEPAEPGPPAGTRHERGAGAEHRGRMYSDRWAPVPGARPAHSRHSQHSQHSLDTGAAGNVWQHDKWGAHGGRTGAPTPKPSAQDMAALWEASLNSATPT